MKLRLLFLLFFSGMLLLTCNNPKNSIEDDAIKLIKMEKKIVDLTIQLNKEESKKLEQERDSISDALQQLSQELQEKYRKADLLQDFQKTYDDLKRKK